MLKKIFIFVFIISVFVLPAFVSAESVNFNSNSYTNYSEEQLVSLIAKLQKQLEEVRKSSVACVVSSRDLSVGDGFEDDLRSDVKSLQGFLYEKGFLSKKQDGLFGKNTKAALIAFQAANNLVQTGELNSETRNKIKSMTCRKSYSVDSSKINKKENSDDNYSKVKSISLSANGSAVKWSADGYSKNGFKIVWSKNSNPTYPTREGDKYIYLSESNANTTNLDAFSGSGTYYVKVCEYLGGSCGVYSNQIQVSL